ncbi:ABC transporter substrate-binding protein [Bacillus sp. OK048]|uniref:ABC transporter substrate-binding protein n=1 Tax=Bacillus sp. OK048 TaxID=1882761 RepID=UPI00088AD3CE|nr:4,5-dihydroxyphthalate decarboxylase [Bacillus sp. OK048]SDM40430.1 4,5-dihydroxyphthalate decarboxylase [Bacillus sp. OK048]
MLKLSLATGDYDRCAPIHDGRVRVQGVNLFPLHLDAEELFFRMARYQDIDVAEFSLSSYVMGVSRGSSPFIALPVFLSRAFRHGNILVRNDAGITSPEQLIGRRIGVPEYQMTALVWQRGILEDEYGVSPESITWVTGGEEQSGRKERVPWTPPANLTVEEAPEGKTLTSMLLAGEIDGLLCARLPKAFDEGDPRISRLFPNYKAVEMDYYRKTGIFPIMHTVVVKKDVYHENPWVAQELVKSFNQAREIAKKNLFDTTAIKTMLPWFVADAEEARQFFKDDLWTYGLEKNRKALETFLDYHYKQGLSERRVKIEELFAPNTIEEFAI